jgi:CubicO group peptidase (beta-lactamase class C family)
MLVVQSMLVAVVSATAMRGDSLMSRDSLAMPRKAPADAGMSADRLGLVDHVVQLGLGASGFPGAAVIVGHDGAVVWEKGYGFLDWQRGIAVDPRTTIYDLASVTKVVATSTAAMVLYDRGKLRLDDPVSRFLPEYRSGSKARVTVRDLLMHRSGLPAGRDLYRSAKDPSEARRLVLGTALDAEPGTHEEYSDLGADVLGFVIESVAHEPLDRFLERTVYRPLGMQSTGFRPASFLRSRTAPTEGAPPRGHAARGEVHDENAYALGGVAGHAGLFGTASDLAVFAQMMLDGGTYHGVRIVSDSTVARFTARTAGTMALGWETCDGGGSCGQFLGPTAFGHTGYTGTSLWIDPERRLFVIVLTNWVHAAPGRPVAPLAVLHDVRSDVADLAALSVLGTLDGGRPLPNKMRADRAIGWRGTEAITSWER